MRVEVAVLKRMREHAKTLSVTLWLVIFAFIGTTFLVWGFRSTSGGGVRTDAIATVEGEKIPFAEYQEAFRLQYQQYQKALGDKFNEKILDRVNMKEQIVEALITRHLLLREANRLGLVITPDELVAEITKLPAFNDPKGFSRERYLRTLEAVRLRPEKFEEGLRRDLMLRKVEQWVRASVNLLPDDAWEGFRLSRGSVKVEYLMFSDQKGQQETIQRVTGLVNARKSWEEIVKASGLKPLSTDFFSSDQEVKRVPDQDSFKDAALALEKGAISSEIQGTKASYIIRVVDRKDPDPAAYEREKAAYRRGISNKKQDQVFADWVRQVRARAKVKIDQASL